MKIRLQKKIKNLSQKGFFKEASKEEKILDCPKSIYKLSLFTSTNAILQAVVDIVVEFLIISGLFVKLPLRLEFLFLTAISALLASHTLNGLRQKELDVTQDSAQVSLLVEISLFLGDLFFVLTYAPTSPLVIFIRLPFMILTFLNILIITYTIFRLELFEFNLLRKAKEFFSEAFAPEK